MGTELEKIEQGIPTATRLVPERKPRTSREITVKFTPKKIVIPALAVVAVIAVAFVVWRILPRKTADLPAGGEPILSIAVLPFGYTGTNANLEYLSEGMPESIISSLQQLSSLKKVIALSSVMRYKGKDADPQVVKQELGVDAVLISKISQVENELSIRVELVRTADNSRIWGEHYKLKASEIFNVQEEISTAVAENLRLKLGGEEKKRLAKHNTENSAAYQDYLTGRFYWNKRTKEGVARSLEYFTKAIEKDPRYALAVSGKKAGAEKILATLNELSGNSYVSAYDKATIYLGLGDDAKALEYLEKAFEERAGYISMIKVDPRFERFRANPRFIGLLKKIYL